MKADFKLQDADIVKIKTEFDRFYEQIRDNIIESEQDSSLGDATSWFKKVIDYNLPHGKKNRGLAVVISYVLIKNEIKLEEKLMKYALILGWCVELLQAFFLVADDIMDQSITRRGQLCWYQNDHVGNIAINDSLFLESSIFTLLKQMRLETFYVDVIELFLKTINQTIYGQCLDTMSLQKDFSSFTDDRYKTIVTYKTTFYSFNLPILLAFHLGGIVNSESEKAAKDILFVMGFYFQVQDDYLDCYGDSTVTGKVGTDIEDYKCSWLIVQALKYASDQQKEILINNYGKTDKACVDKVKIVYDQLKLKDLYKEFEENSYEEILKLIEKHSSIIPKEVFLYYVSLIYKRERDTPNLIRINKDPHKPCNMEIGFYIFQKPGSPIPNSIDFNTKFESVNTLGVGVAPSKKFYLNLSYNGFTAFVQRRPEKDLSNMKNYLLVYKSHCCVKSSMLNLSVIVKDPAVFIFEVNFLS